MELFTVLALLTGALLVIAVVLLIVGDYQLVLRLKRDHRSTWEHLGSPSPYFTQFEHVASIHRFLFERQYRSLGDAGLALEADRLRRLTTTVYLLGAIALGLSVLGKLSR